MSRKHIELDLFYTLKDIYITLLFKGFGSVRLFKCFERRLLYSSRLHLFEQHSKNGDIMKYEIFKYLFYFNIF